MRGLFDNRTLLGGAASRERRRATWCNRVQPKLRLRKTNPIRTDARIPAPPLRYAPGRGAGSLSDRSSPGDRVIRERGMSGMSGGMSGPQAKAQNEPNFDFAFVTA